MPEKSSQAISTKHEWLRIICGGVFFFVLSGNSCLGQITSRVLVTAPREYKRALDLAQRDLDNEEYASAIDRLEALLHGDEEQSLKEDFFVGSTSAARYEASLRSRAEQMLANLPPKARELYELQFGAEARLALETAVAEFDIAKLASVRRRYSATESGLVASMILGRHYLNSQRPMAALLCFEQMNSSPVAREKFGAELSLLLAMAARRAGQSELARETLVALKQDDPDASYQIADQWIEMFGNDDDALSWLDKTIGTIADAASIPVADWLTHRGNNQRNAEASGSMPLLNFLWEVNITNNLHDIESIRELRDDSLTGVRPLVPSIQPLVTAGTAFIRGPRRLVAVDIKTGKRIWDFGWYDQSVDMTSAQSEKQRRDQVRYRLLEDAVYGRLASDGELLYLVGQPRANENNYSYLTPQQNAMRVQFGQIPPANNQPNLLIALDIATEGKYRWKVGGKTGEQEPALAGAFFLGPPIVVDDELYVIADRNNEISLFALDRGTGKLRWTQQLAHSDPRARYYYYNQRRRAGAVPSYANGVLVCPTSSGAVVAVDIASRSLLWGYQYPISLNQRRRSSNNLVSAGNWLDSSVAISDGKVVLTPVESGEMHCLSLANGESIWTRPVKRADKLFVASVRKGIVSVVGKHFVRGFDLESGQQKWTLSLDVRKPNDRVKNLPAGFGFRSGDHYFLPTVDSILKINIVTGKLTDSADCSETLGNIVPYNNQILSLGLDYLRLYHQVDSLTKTVERRLDESPDDPWALEQNGALLFKAGEVDAGLMALRKAIETYSADAPERDRAKQLLVSVALVALDRDYIGNPKLAEEIERWIDRPQDRQRYLLLRANGMLASQQPRRAFDAFAELVFSERLNNIEYATSTADEKSQYVIRQDRSIRAGIAAVLKLASESDAAAMRSDLKRQCDQLLSAGDVGRISAAVNELGDLPVADSLRLFAADQLAADQPVVAELMLLPALDSDQPEIAAEAYCLTAKIYAAADFHRAAARCYSIAREKWPNATLKSGQTVEELCSQIPFTSSVGKHLRPEPKWSYGATTFDQMSKTSGFRNRPSLMVSLVQQRSVTPHAPKLDFWHDGSNFVTTDRLGRERTRIPATRRATSTKASSTSRQLGSLCFVNFGSTIVAVNNLTPIDPTKNARRRPQSMLWPRNNPSGLARTPPRSAGLGRSKFWKQTVEFPRNRHIHGIATSSVNGLAFLRNRQLVCVDPLSGEEVWSRDDIQSNSRVWGDDQHVFVAGATSARVFDLIDGHELPEVDITTSERRWTTLGRDIVTWDNGTSDDNVTTRVLCLFDPLTQKNKWTYECKYSEVLVDDQGDKYKMDGAGHIADNEFACIIEPDGRCLVIELATGSLAGEFKFDLPADHQLNEANLIVSDNQFIVVAYLKLRTDPGFIHTNAHVDAPLRQGLMQAIDRRTGMPQWASVVEIDRFGMFKNQPEDVPVLLFARNTRPRALKNRISKPDIICLDKRDGRTLFVLERQPSSSPEYRIQANSEQAIDFRFSSNRFRLQFSDEPVAPAPPSPIRIERLAPEPEKAAASKPKPKSKRIVNGDNPFEFDE